MQSRRSGDQDNPLGSKHCQMRAFDWDLIRGGHYGQRSCEPHLKAEHMAAPTNAAKREKSSCQPGAVHTWHIASFSAVQRYVRSWGKTGSGWQRLEPSLLTQVGHRRSPKI